MLNSKVITNQNKYLSRVLIDAGFNLVDSSDNSITLKATKEKHTISEYAALIGGLLGAIYFLLIDYHLYYSLPFIFFFLIALTVFLIYPKRINNQYFKFRLDSRIIEYRFSLSDKTNTFTINAATIIYCQIDDYGTGFNTNYSASFYYKATNGDPRLFMQFNSKYKRDCIKYANAFIRYLTTLSDLKQIKTIDNVMRPVKWTKEKLPLT